MFSINFYTRIDFRINNFSNRKTLFNRHQTLFAIYDLSKCDSKSKALDFKRY